MPIDQLNPRRARWAVMAALPLLAACQSDLAAIGKEPLSTFGEANRQTMMAQVVDPDPQYDTLNPATSAEHAGQAIERYQKGSVKKPERISTQSVEGGGR